MNSRNLPSPFDWMMIYCSHAAASTAIWADIFGNHNPADQAPIGFSLAMLTAMPVYIWWTWTRKAKR